MPFPALGPEGFLPAGIFECTWHELKAQFGTFEGSDHRVHLFTRLRALASVMTTSGLFEGLIIDGSFVTSKPRPNDVDLIAILRPG